MISPNSFENVAWLITIFLFQYKVGVTNLNTYYKAMTGISAKK